MKIKTGSDFSGVGAFDQAIARLGIEQDKIFACDLDKYARQTYIHNYGEPAYYPENVYDREIPEQPLDIYMTSPPCQAFSLAGKRKGETDKRGILFYNSHEFIQKNKPRYFIFENVKGLLSDDAGKTFQRWIDFLGGKSVNGNPVIFPLEEAVPYHVYYKVLNAKDFGVPQNRERVFIIGIRDDQDNNFNWPKPFPLEKRLKDVLEPEVEEKYFLSERLIKGFTNSDNNFCGKFEPKTGEDTGNCITASCAKTAKTDNFIKTEIGAIRGRNPQNPSDRTTGAPTRQRLEINHNGTSNTLTSVQKDNVVVYSNKRLNETLEKNGIPKETTLIDSYNKNYNSEVAHTITTRVNANNETSLYHNYKIRKLTPRECFRLMDFPDTFTWPVSDSQAYKQAGNSIVVAVLAAIIDKLKL